MRAARLSSTTTCSCSSRSTHPGRSRAARAASARPWASATPPTRTRSGSRTPRWRPWPMPEPLALHGGTPVRSTPLPYARQSIEEDDVQAVAAALRSDWLTTGPQVEQFERALAGVVQARHAVAVNSGTAALHAAVFAAGIGPGDEVITSPLTFAASANAVVYLGGTPVFADIRTDTLNADPAAVEALITPRTRGIVPVDFAGQPCDLDALMEIARIRQLVTIEDAAHALGASHKGRPVGAIADLTTFSFHPAKLITTGEGGLVTTASEDLAGRLRRFRNHA